MKDKDAFYFPHFCNARSDRKIRRLRRILGIEGYGIFFMLLETLREQSDYRYPIEDIDLLADEFGTSKEKVESVINQFDLFMLDNEGNFFSSNLVMYLQPYLEGKDRKKIGGLVGNLIRYKGLLKEDLKSLSDSQIISLYKTHYPDTIIETSTFPSYMISHSESHSESDSDSHTSLIRSQKKGKESYESKLNQKDKPKRNGREILFDLVQHWNESVPKQRTIVNPENMPIHGEMVYVISNIDSEIVKTAISNYGEAYELNKYPVSGFTGFLSQKHIETWYVEDAVKNVLKRQGKTGQSVKVTEDIKRTIEEIPF